MAHTERRPGDDRKHPVIHPIGSRVGIQTGRGTLYGRVYHHDAGGWIYVKWSKGQGSTPPHFLRSTNVFKAE